MQKYELVDTTKYQRDAHSKAIISSDINALKAYKIARKRATQVNSYGEDINTLKEEMSEIKSLLQQLLADKSREP